MDSSRLQVPMNAVILCCRQALILFNQSLPRSITISLSIFPSLLEALCNRRTPIQGSLGSGLQPFFFTPSVMLKSQHVGSSQVWETTCCCSLCFASAYVVSAKLWRKAETPLLSLPQNPVRRPEPHRPPFPWPCISSSSSAITTALCISLAQLMGLI